MSVLLFPLHGAILVINLAVLVVVVAAVLDVLIRPSGAFVAAGKQTKLFWLLALILGSFLFIVGLVAAIVYFVDVRPALRAAGTGGGSAGGGSSSDGPYGPYRG